MTPSLMLKGLAIGFSIAAPVGRIGFLCIRRSLAEGQRAGLATGLGAATADAVYGCAGRFWPHSGFELSGRSKILARAGWRRVPLLPGCPHVPKQPRRAVRDGRE